VIESLGDGDELVEMAVRSDRRRAGSIRIWPRTSTCAPSATSARLSATHPAHLSRRREGYPAAELRGLYHERREIELGFGELKADMLERREAIPSRALTP
jgi:hypothetical protein